MRMFKLKPLALCIATLSMTPAVWAQSSTSAAAATSATDVGRISVEGLQGGTGTGLIVQEETPKARSSVNRESIEKGNPIGNPYQAMELLPGVNTFSNDATGLFGGGLRVRGANSDQMGFTVNGVPVNDSGNFAVYPMEYVDSENICEVFLTQGSTDTDAPHVGASGGNVGITYCAPEDKYRFRAAQTLGDLHTTRTFLRVDTGKFADETTKLFLSYSNSRADKFKGMGGAFREHFDAGVEVRPNASWLVSSDLSWNKMFNNNFSQLTRTQIASGGKNQDFSALPAVNPAPVGGTTQTVANVTDANTYYMNTVNPFLDVIWSGKAEYKLNKDISFSAEPYFWYGHGTGGNLQKTLTESTNSGANAHYGVADINKDGDTRDTQYIYSGSVTETYRPGITLKTNMRLEKHDVLLGVWYEQARHIQTGPAERLDANGNVSDPWLWNSSQFLTYNDGATYNSRNQLTVSTAASLFAQDKIRLMDDKMTVQAGLRGSQINRDFYNYSNSNSTNKFGASTADYNYNQTYGKWLPSIGIGYKLDEQQQVFANVAQNMRAPSNFSFQNLLQGGTVVNGALTNATLRTPTVNMETSTNVDVGYRLASDKWTFSGSVFYNDFQNRIASSYDATSNYTTDFNVGAVKTMGVELETGYKINNTWSLYGSTSYTSSTMQDNMQVSNGQTTPALATLPTSGAQMPDTPRWMAGLRLAYETGTWYGNADVKYTGSAYSTLVNDDAMSDYAVVNASIGYRFQSALYFKKPSIQFNVSNLFGQEYLRISSPSGSSFATTANGVNGIKASPPSYYVSAPMYLSVTLRADF